jgi:N-acetylglucosamine-6-phosphate deacetylase
LLLRSDRVVGPAHVGPGWIEIVGDRIEAMGVDFDDHRGHGPVDVDLGDGLVVPGFVDIHVHGGGGHSFQGGAAEATAAAAFHRAHGTTTVMASLVSAPIDELVAAVASLAPLVSDGIVAGVHLEGPFISAAHCGAHDPRHLRAPEPAQVDRLLDAPPGVIRMMTVAPELVGGMAAIGRLVAGGVTAAIGHTNASYEETAAAIALGATVATHLFNGMPPIHHRAPGPVLACLAAPAVAIELIADGIHLHEAVVKQVQEIAGARTVLITDAMSAAGVGDGIYRLGDRAVDVRGGEVRLVSNGALAGSVLTLDRALRNAVRFGVPWLSALEAVTVAPARAVGLDDKAGVLAPGRRADLVVLDADLEVEGVLAAGQWIVAAPPAGAAGDGGC